MRVKDSFFHQTKPLTPIHLSLCRSIFTFPSSFLFFSFFFSVRAVPVLLPSASFFYGPLCYGAQMPVTNTPLLLSSPQRALFYFFSAASLADR